MLEENNITEEWRDVVGYEGLYSVSNLGRVKRVASWCNSQRMNLEMKIGLDSHGYHRIGLNRSGVRLRFQLHRIVMAAFVGPIPEGHQVNHINGDKVDNRACNLEYLTQSQNLKHDWRVLKSRNQNGSKNPSAKLTEEMVLEIRNLRAQGIAYEAIAARFGMSHWGIQDICYRRRWKHI